MYNEKWYFLPVAFCFCFFCLYLWKDSSYYRIEKTLSISLWFIVGPERLPGYMCACVAFKTKYSKKLIFSYNNWILNKLNAIICWKENVLNSIFITCGNSAKAKPPDSTPFVCLVNLPTKLSGKRFNFDSLLLSNQKPCLSSALSRLLWMTGVDSLRIWLGLGHDSRFKRKMQIKC